MSGGFRRVLLLAVVAGSIVCPATNWAQENRSRESSANGSSAASSTAETTAQSDRLRFRRVYVPAERFDDIAKETIPLRRDRFEEMVGAFTHDPAAVQQSRLASCLLAARLEEGELVGMGQLRVRQADESNSFLSLAPCRLPIASAWWTEVVEEIPLGYDPQGNLGALIDRSGLAHFQWSSPSKANNPGYQQFELTLPASPMNKVLLLAPKGQAVMSSAGMLRQIKQIDSEPWSWWDESLGEDQTAWLLELGGATQATLQLESAPEESSLGQQPGYRQTTRYQLALREIDIISDIYLDRPVESLATLEVAWPASLNLISVNWDKQALSWESTSHGEQPAASIALPSGAAAGGIPISLHFQGKPIVGGGQALPRIRVANAYWREGTAKLQLTPPLGLTRVELKESLMEAAAADDDRRAPEQLTFRLLHENAEVRVSTRLQQPQATARSLALLEFDSEAVRGKYRAELTSTQGELFLLAAEIGTNWTIDSVEAVAHDTQRGNTADALRDWNLSAADGGSQRLDIRLQQPLGPNQTITLTVAAHERNTSLEGKLSLRELQFLKLDDLSLTRHYLACRADSSRGLQLESPGSAKLIEPEELPQSLAPWYVKQAASADYPLLMESTGSIPEVQLRLSRATPRYTARMTSHWSVTPKSLLVKHEVVCQPQSGAITRLLVRSGSKEGPPLQWSLAGESTLTVTPRLLHEDMEGAIWELGIYPPRSQNFTLLAERVMPRHGSQSLGLVSFPEAASQSALVEVEASAAGVQYVLRPQGLLAAPVTAAGSHPEHLYSRYRYRAGESPQLEIVSDLETTPAGLLQVWNFWLDSLYTAQRVRHVAHYRIENRGLGQFEVQLPADVHLREVQLGGEKATAVTRGPDRRLSIMLPAGKRFVSIRLVYEEPKCEPWSLWRNVQAKLPATEWPPLQATWQVKASPEIALWNGSAAARADQSISWQARLLGPLAAGTAPTSSPEAGNSETATAAAMPWHATAEVEPIDAREIGWSAVRLPLDDDQPAQITLTRPAGWQVLSTSLLLLSAAFSLLVCRRHARRLVLILGVTSLLCLLAPSMLAGASSGLFLGALLAAVWLAFVKYKQRNQEAFAPSSNQEASTATAANFQMIVSWLLLSATLAGLLIGSGGHADLFAQQAEEKEQGIYPVFIPIDSREEPQGNYVHLPEDFYKALHRRYRDHRSPNVAWLLHEAQYTCRLTQVSEPAGDSTVIQAPELRFEAQLSVLRSDVPIKLPLHAAELTLVEGSAFLGGNPVEPTWSEDQQFLQITPPATGQFRLELRFKPQVTSSSGRNVLKLNIPPAADARLEIIHPAGMDGFHLSPSVPLTPSEVGRTTAHLGPVSSWELELPSSSLNDRSLAAEQLTWLHLKPGAAIWDLKCRYTPTAGSTSFVEWEVDPNLRLLTLSVDGAEYARHTRFTDRRLINIQLIEPVSEPFTVEAKFIQEESHGMGRLKLPLLRAVGAQQDRRWLAVSGAQSLELTVNHDPMVESLPATEFLSAWESETQPPDRAFRLLAPQPAWSVMATPRPQQVTARTLSTISLGAGQAQLEYEVSLAASQQAQPLYQFDLPEGFRLTQAELYIGSRSESLQGAVEGNHLLLRVPRPTTKAHRLVLELVGPPPQRAYQLPLIDMRNVTLESAEYRVFRHSDLEVQFPGAVPQGSRFASADLRYYSRERGRLAGVFLHEDEEVSTAWPKAIVRKNAPRVKQGELIMALARPEGQWQLQLTLRGEVTGGLLDTLRLVAPGHLPPPTVNSSTISLETLRLPGESRVQWMLHPHQPLSGEFALELSVPLEYEPGMAPRVPLIEVPGEQPITTYLILPRRVSHQEAAWTLTGLEPVEAPSAEPRERWLPTAADSYLATGDYAASLHLESPQRLEPQVRLADIQLVIQPPGHYFGTVAFDMEPGGLHTCHLQLPEGLTLQRVMLDSGAVSVHEEQSSSKGGKVYRCLIGEADLPHRLEVLFSGTPPAAGASASIASGDDRLQLPVPRLMDIPVERTLWTIQTPAGMTLPTDSSSVRAITAVRHVGFRLQATATLAEPPAHLVTSVSKSDLALWYGHWVERMVRYYRSGQSLIEEGQQAEYPLHGNFLRERGEMAARMGVSKQFKAALKQAPAAAVPEQQWQLTQITRSSYDSPSDPIYAMSQGAAEALELKVAATPRYDYRLWLVAMLLAVLTVAAYRFLRNRSPSEWIVWWLHPTAVLLGIAWWLWLTPAAIGWLIIVIALIGSLRSPWRMQTLDGRRSLAVGRNK